MSFTLNENQVDDLINYIDRHLRSAGCDHSHRFAAAWANENSVDWDDLLDALEEHSAFCDCEVVLNLPEGPLVHEAKSQQLDQANRWLLPPDFKATLTQTSKILISRAGVGRNNHTQEGEWLVPAPLDAKPRKRIRKSVHFFIGIESELPTEIGFVAEVEPMALDVFTEHISTSTAPELAHFDCLVAAFFCQKIARLPDGAAVGVDVFDRVGIASKHQEMKIHRVILRR